MVKSLTLLRLRRASALSLVFCILTGAAAFGFTVWKQLDWWRAPLQRYLPDHTRRVMPRTPAAAAIVRGAKEQEGTFYDARYAPLRYPLGDMPPGRGACSDVVIRSFRKAGYDLQKLIHEDMQASPQAYGLTSVSPKLDTNIDHRRVKNQQRFFLRQAMSLSTDMNGGRTDLWLPGDVVEWRLADGELHTGIVSDGVSDSGTPLVVHNASLCAEADCLPRWPIIGHFRFPAG